MRRSLTGLSWVVAASAIPLAVLHVAGPTVSAGVARFPDTFAWIAVGVLLVGCAVGSAVHRAAPAATRATSLITAAAGAALVAARALDHRGVTSRETAEILLAASQALIITGLVILARRRLGSNSSGVLIDSLIVGMGAWIVVWVLLINPSLDDTTGGLLASSRATTLGAAIIVLFLLATVVFSEGTTPPSLAFVGSSTALVLTCVVARAVDARAGGPLDQTAWIDAALIASLPLAGAAIIHPTVDRLGSAGTIRPSSPLMARLTSTTASLIAPIIVLALTDPTDTRDRTVRAVSVCVLAVVVMARVVQSVRTNAHTQDRLVRGALTDSLTGLPNRSLMIDHIEEAIAGARRTRRQPTVLFVDVDRFKNINDSLGHAAGDSVLTQVASRLVRAVGPTATVARIAGDEFVVLDDSTETPTQSVVLAEKVLDAFSEPVAGGSGDMFVTASIGVAYAPRGVPLGAEDLMRHADAAMYRAKDAGRNCIALFDESMLDRVTRRLEVETALYKALERQELRLVHQPIVDVDLGIVVGFEALMRWDRGSEGIVAPSDFIPIAEETGTIIPLGSWAMKDALVQLRLWIDSGVCPPSTSMSVNVSPRQLQDPHFVTTVGDALTISGIPPDQLWIEVTESVMISEPDQTIGALHRLDSLGVRIAIDDFGTGYSSLSLLQQFPVHCIKIDRAFVSGIAHNEGTRNIVRTIIAMASSLGADIVAEGVENNEQLSVLRGLRCSRAQGYLIGRPVPSEDIPSVVSAIHDPQNLESLRRRITWADQPS